MKKGGRGGAHTRTGLKFEADTHLGSAIAKVAGYEVNGNQVYHAGKLAGVLVPQHSLYRDLLKPRGVDGRAVLSKLLLPDEALFTPATKRVHILEKKFQKVAGSVDEKLQTCHFKLQQYSRLVKAAGLTVTYSYVLNDWFNKPEYRDTLEYVKSVGARYYFYTVPLRELDL